MNIQVLSRMMAAVRIDIDTDEDVLLTGAQQQAVMMTVLDVESHVIDLFLEKNSVEIELEELRREHQLAIRMMRIDNEVLREELAEAVEDLQGRQVQAAWIDKDVPEPYAYCFYCDSDTDHERCVG